MKVDFEQVINSKQYDFLRTNEHLGNKIILLGLGGSYAYGTNVETSDIDIRGCALNSKEELLGNRKFEQFVNFIKVSLTVLKIGGSFGKMNLLTKV